MGNELSTKRAPSTLLDEKFEKALAAIPEDEREYTEEREISQASRIIEKFGGVRRLAAVLTMIGRPKDPATIYRWLYPAEKGGTGGIIPTRSHNDVFAAARADGIVISSEELDPRPTIVNTRITSNTLQRMRAAGDKASAQRARTQRKLKTDF